MGLHFWYVQAPLTQRELEIQLLLKSTQGSGSSLNPFSGLDTRNHCHWRGPVPAEHGCPWRRTKTVRFYWEKLCFASWCSQLLRTTHHPECWWHQVGRPLSWLAEKVVEREQDKLLPILILTIWIVLQSAIEVIHTAGSCRGTQPGASSWHWAQLKQWRTMGTLLTTAQLKACFHTWCL